MLRACALLSWAVFAGAFSGVPSVASGLASRRSVCVATLSAHTVSSDEKHDGAVPRSNFLRTAAAAALGAAVTTAAMPLQSVEAAVTADGHAGLASEKKSPTQFIDVAVDLGLGDDKVLSVRQPFGLPKQSSEEQKGGGDRQGTYVWPASTDMGRFLVSARGRSLVRGKQVIELGAGTAISGLAASMAGAAHVTFTDGSPEVLSVTRDTVRRNSLTLNRGNLQASRGASVTDESLLVAGPTSVERLRWGNAEDLTALLAKTRTNGNSVDVVLGAEITYLSASIDPLLETIHALLSSSQRSAIPSNMKPVRAPVAVERDLALASKPIALLTFTSELTAFDGEMPISSSISCQTEHDCMKPH